MSKPDLSQPVMSEPDISQPDPASGCDRPVVVKLGGKVPAPAVLDDVAGLAAAGTGVVLVHGGSEAIDQLAGELSVPVRTLQSQDGTSSRQTDQPMLDVVTLALLGRVKPALVRGLAARGVRGAGVSGADGGVVLAEQKTVLRAATGGRRYVVRDDLSGRITGVHPGLLWALLDRGYLPVLSPPAAAADGRLLNVDADRLASAVAVALGARALVLLTDVPGLLTDIADASSVLPRVSVTGGAAAAPDGVRGRMKHKHRAAAEAACGGVPTVIIASGLVPAPVSAALGGAGTSYVRLAEPR